MIAPELILFALFAAIAAGAIAFVLAAYRRAGGARRAPALAGAAGAGVLALGLYMLIGQPDLPDAPYAERIEALKQRPLDSYTNAEMLARFGAEAAANPHDPRPHLASGLLLAELGQDEQAARAFEAALRREPNSPLALVNLGRVMVRLDGGRVGPEAAAVFAQAAALDPQDPTPWLYQALAADQAGDGGESARLWREVLARLAPNDPRRAMAREMIARAGR